MMDRSPSRWHRRRGLPFALSLLVLVLSFALVNAGDFFFEDFEITAGLRFNGVAGVSDCSDATNYNYTSLDDMNDQNADDETPQVYRESTDTASITTTVTADTINEVANVSRFKAVFPHRSSAMPALRKICPKRLRLTPSRPTRVGSVMGIESHPVMNGFETGFTFQITDHSLSCTQVKDRQFSMRTYQSCAVNGGDGFAFVIHNDANFSKAIGHPASGLGYAGLRNALAIEFDTWSNTEPGIDDLLFDHVAVQASPSLVDGRPNPSLDNVITEASDTRLAPMARASLADGKVHKAKIAYYRYLRYDYLPYFAASPNLLPLLQDDGEAWRLGTLVVFVDDMTKPLVALPLNLNSILKLPENQAYIGFTASTGKNWQKHDILEWYWCDSDNCSQLQGDAKMVSYKPEIVVGGN